VIVAEVTYEVTYAAPQLDIGNVSTQIKISEPSATIYARPRRSLTVAKN
jgi:hypothetical protein